MNGYKGLLVKGRSVAANFLHLGTIQASNALVQILLFPFIIRITGIEAFGPVVVANSFAALMGLAVNYGTSISGIQSVAAAHQDRQQLSRHFSQILMLRSVLLIVPFLALALAKAVAPGYFLYLLLAMPLVLAELINPLYFFNGSEHLLPYNIGNLISKLAAASLIVLFVQDATSAAWVNFFLGLPSILLFLLLNVYLFKSWQLQWLKVEWKTLRCLLRKNLPLASNNLSVQLQQSFFLFALTATNNAVLLAAYAIADKVLWGFRLVLIAFSGALLPKAVIMAKQDEHIAKARKQQINTILVIVFLGVALFLYFEAPLAVQLFAGKTFPQAVTLVRAVAFVPLLAALNALNVIEMLVKEQYRSMFAIALLLTALTVITSVLILQKEDTGYIAFYPFIMESAALILYLIFLNRKKADVHIA
jgi:O-antigen/teichoic acid export membrane protein